MDEKSPRSLEDILAGPRSLYLLPPHITDQNFNEVFDKEKKFASQGRLVKMETVGERGGWGAVVDSELGTWGIFNFCNNKKWFFAFLSS